MRKSTGCPVKAATDVIGGKWKAGILFRLQNGPYRPSALRREMPWISEKVLTQQLRELENDNIVRRIDYQLSPPRVEYTLTEYGQTLRPLLTMLCAWGEQHLNQQNSSWT